MRGIEHIPWLYDAMMELADRGRLGQWRRRTVRNLQGRILEVGCGTGRNLPLYPDDARVVGLEPDLGTLGRARKRAPETSLVVGRAEDLPFPDRTFDVVVSSLVFCSVDRPAEGLREARRVLPADGELRMLEHVRAEGSLPARLQDLVQPLWTWITGGCRPNRDTEARVQEAGFRIHPGSRKARGTLRSFRARPDSVASPSSGPGSVP
ncbi:MAG: methyltransferase domain-containing protein [Thermoanaerobaculia bacterium]|nr:methyltransferase domain-containing protein [Thermoanaerobaculia bacterium]